MENSKSIHVNRDSNFELLRIVSMFFIILYHLIYFFECTIFPDIPFWEAMKYTLHIGVICFILISGYYGINSKLKGVVHLLLLTCIYYIPLSLVDLFIFKINYPIFSIKYLALSIMPLTGGPYWFIVTYLWLYLLAPMVNKYIQDSKRNTVYLLSVTGFASLYMSLTGGDPSLLDGKNITNFIFIYCLGHYLKHYSTLAGNIKTKYILCVYIFLNVALICLRLADNPTINSILYKTFLSYSSIGLVINATLLFILFSRLKFKNGLVNNVASSTFSMYLLHHQPLMLFGGIQSVVVMINNTGCNIWLILVMLLAFTSMLMISFWLFDMSLRPMFSRLENRLVSFVLKFNL